MNKIEYEDLICFHPGYYVKEIIDELNISQTEFANRLQVSGKTISMLLSGSVSISNDLAIKLSKMTGTSIGVWMNLQKTYDEKKAEIERRKQEDQDVEICSLIDYKYFVNLNVVNKTKKKIEQVRELCKFFNVCSLSVLKQPDFLVNYRVGVNNMNEKHIINSRAWVQTALKFGNKINNPNKFNEKVLIKYLPQIREMTLMESNFFLPELQNMFYESGVDFIILPYLKNSGINGIVKWIDRYKVVLAINDRRSYADTFWFSLFHEIKHVLQQKIKVMFINSESRTEQGLMEIDKKLEEEADKFAQNYLIPESEYKAFINDNTHFNEDVIKKFSKKIAIHPGIVVGRLQNDGHVGYNKYHSLRQKYKIDV